MFYEVMLEGLKKFAGEIVGVLLLVAAWRVFPGLRKLFGQYESLKSKHPAMSDEVFISLCKFGNIAEVEEAIKNGANVNAKKNDGWTVLIYVAWAGYTEIAELLIKHGADVNVKDDDGRTALIWAVWADNTEIAELLIKHGADVNAKDDDGRTALMEAAWEGNTGIEKLLRFYGAKK